MILWVCSTVKIQKEKRKRKIDQYECSPWSYSCGVVLRSLRFTENGPNHSANRCSPTAPSTGPGQAQQGLWTYSVAAFNLNFLTWLTLNSTFSPLHYHFKPLFCFPKFFLILILYLSIMASAQSLAQGSDARASFQPFRPLSCYGICIWAGLGRTMAPQFQVQNLPACLPACLPAFAHTHPPFLTHYPRQ